MVTEFIASQPGFSSDWAATKQLAIFTGGKNNLGGYLSHRWSASIDNISAQPLHNAWAPEHNSHAKAAWPFAGKAALY